MGFESVYKCLRELFSEIDHRVLRVVALEHSTDVQAAVNDVLMDVIPRYHGNINLRPQNPGVESASEQEGAVENETKKVTLSDRMDMNSLESDTTDSETSDDTSQESGMAYVDAALDQSVSVNNSIASDDGEQSHENNEPNSITLSASIQEGSNEVGLNHVAPEKSNDLVYEDGECNKCEEIHGFSGTANQVTEDTKQDNTLFDGVDGILNDFHSDFIRDLNMNMQEFYSMNSNYGTISANENMNMQEFYSMNSNYGTISANENYDNQITNTSIGNHSLLLSELNLHSVSDNQKSNANSSPNPGFNPNCCTSELSGIEDGLMGHTIISQSDQCDFDLLDEIIEDAKHNKVTLFSAMQSVINEMKELEHKEKQVENVKEEAANGESESLAKVEEMKRTVAHAKELNDMHAGEVYGEKAILGTETTELHSRLLRLSDERDNSLSILDEMHTTLEARIAAVDAMLKATEEKKLAKEEHARKALAEQEALMDKIVQESTILRQEAEENSKLRQFLIDRGQLVDVLQGEMSVICQDVRMLKEKFDMHVPLSKSLCSSQTSCILASSGSSLRTAGSDMARFSLSVKDIIPSYVDAEKDATSSLRKEEGSRTSSVSSSSLSTNGREEKRGRNHFKAFSDDGWEVCNGEALLAEAPYSVDTRKDK